MTGLVLQTTGRWKNSDMSELLRHFFLTQVDHRHPMPAGLLKKGGTTHPAHAGCLAGGDFPKLEVFQCQEELAALFHLGAVFALQAQAGRQIDGEMCCHAFILTDRSQIGKKSSFTCFPLQSP
jgi:hypothetical protein